MKMKGEIVLFEKITQPVGTGVSSIKETEDRLRKNAKSAKKGLPSANVNITSKEKTQVA